VALLSLLSRLKMHTEQRCGETVRVVSIHETGLDGFWIHRLLQANSIDSHMVDAVLSAFGPAPAYQALIVLGIPLLAMPASNGNISTPKPFFRRVLEYIALACRQHRFPFASFERRVIVFGGNVVSVVPGEKPGSHQILGRRSHSLFRHLGVGTHPLTQYV
jgi:hypothetical protein